MTRKYPNKTSNESEAAYVKAQELLKDWEDGYIPAYRVFTTEEQVRAVFPKIIGGSILNMLGTQFFWKRASGDPLVLYGKNDDKELLKDKGLVEICRFRNFPELWVGVGRFCIDWGELKDKKADTHILIHLYLFSTNVDDLSRLTEWDDANAAYMATLSLGDKNAELFYQLAEQRFESLR